MAATAFDGLTAAKVTLWERQTWQAGRDESFFFSNGFVANDDNGMNYPIHRVSKLTKTSRGLECVMQLIQDLQKDGIVGDGELKGNEEALVNDAQTIQIDQLRHAVRSKGKLSEQATVIDFRAQAKRKLGFWLADKLDELMFLVASGRALTLKLDGSTRGASQLPSLAFGADITAASSNRVIHAGSATSEGTLTASDKMTWNLLSTLRAHADRKRVKPVRMKGKGYYPVVLSTEQMRDLRQDPTYQSILKSGAERGFNNPLFTGSEIVAEGLVVHSHNRTYNTLGATSGTAKWGSGDTVDGAQALLLGAGSLGFAAIGEGKAGELDETDYQNRTGISFGRMIGMLKPQFKSIYDSDATEDFGVVSLKTAAAATA